MTGKDTERITYAQLMRRFTRYVEGQPFRLNPDRVVVQNIIHALTKNTLEYGAAYCPCRSIEHHINDKLGHICPCQGHREEIARQGSCECGLFVR